MLYNIISGENLKKITNKTILTGKHEMFNEFNNDNQFFSVMYDLLEKIT